MSDNETTNDEASTTITFTLSEDKDVEVTIDLDELPEAVTNRLLLKAVKNYVTNSTSQALDRYKKAKAKDASTEAPDYAKVASEAKARLIENRMREIGSGKSKEAKDPIEPIVKAAVTRDLFARMQKKNPKAKWTDAVKKVGASGLAYLAAQAGDDAAKIKAMDEKYIKPARKMMGLDAKGKPVASTEEDGDDGDDLL